MTLFAFGVVAIVAALIQVGTGLDPLRLAVIAVGVTCLALAFVPRVRSADGLTTMGVDLRPVAVALAVGVVVGFAQATSDLEEIFLKVTGQDGSEAAA